MPDAIMIKMITLINCRAAIFLIVLFEQHRGHLQNGQKGVKSPALDKL